MPNMKYQQLICGDAIVDEIRIAQNRYAPMTEIVDDAADLWKEA